MTQRKLNVSTVNYTTSDRRVVLKNMILTEWLKRNHPELIKRVERFVTDHVSDDDAQ
jgi:hypothetical protein